MFNVEYWYGILIFVLLLFILLFPIYLFDESKMQRLILPNMMCLLLLSIFVVFISIYALVYHLPIVLKIFEMDLGDARINLASETYVKQSVYSSMAAVSASLYIYAIILFFVFYIINKYKILTFLLFVSSFSNVLFVLSYVGRDGIVFWIISFCLCFLFFKGFMQPCRKKSILRIFYILVIVLTMPFILISISRFNYDFYYSIISYVGQSLPNFCLYMNIHNYPVDYGSSFPVVLSVLGKDVSISDSWVIGDTSSWVFGSLFKSFIYNFNLTNTFIILIFLGLIFYFYFGMVKKVIEFYKIILYFLYMQVYSQGVFYFVQYTRSGNYFIIISLFLFFIFWFLDCVISQNKKVILYRVSKSNDYVNE